MLTLRRITSGTAFVPQIDGLRFIAIMSVVFFHIYSSLTHNGAIASPIRDPRILLLAKRGVEVFFSISGFILGLPFARTFIAGGPRVSLKAYFLRRLTRLEPPYILNLLIYTAAIVISGQVALRTALPHLLVSMVYCHNLIYRSDSLINGIAWSLEVEVQFYVLVPFAMRLLAVIRGTFARRALLIVGMATWAICSLPLVGTPMYASILYFAPFFIAGLLVADFYVDSRELWASNKSYTWDLVALIGGPLVWFPSQTLAHILLPFLLALLLVSAFRSKIVSRMLSGEWVTSIGGMCYTIYLYHILIIAMCGRVTKQFTLGRISLSTFFCRLV